MTDSPEFPPPESDPIPPVPAPADERHAAVLAAMDRIQNRRPGWTRAIMIFVVSLMLFAGTAGAIVDSVRILGLLIAILFVHETGHYLAMRWFGYRNLRMFFIPFFGAAVSGQNYNVAGWKKVVVSLLGPLPGIVIGMVLGAVAISLKQKPEAEGVSLLLLEISTIAIVINGFNLLPVLPLDGGWIMHALIFCRHPIFDAAFRLLAALSIIAFGILLKGWILLFFGLFLMLGIPVTYRMAKLAQRLRSESIQTRATNGQIAPQTAAAIIEGVEDATGHAASPHIVATHSLQVFEIINATPPGIIVSFLFVLLHIASLGASIGGTLFLTIETQTHFEDFYNLYLSSPQHTYVCEKPNRWSSPGWVASAAEVSLVSHHDSIPQAAKEFQRLSANPPAAGTLIRFGQSLLIDVKDPTAQEQWKKALENDVIDSRGNTLWIRAQCALNPLSAEALKQDCSDYNNWLSASDWAAPPWSFPENLTTAGIERRRKARRIFHDVRKKEIELGLNADLDSDPTLDIRNALKEFPRNEINRLWSQPKDQRLANLREAIVAMRATVSSPVQNQVLDLLLQHELAMPSEFREPEPPEELAELLGRFGRDVDDKISFEDSASKCVAVHVQQEFFLVSFKVQGFESPTVGLTRLAKWLCRHNSLGIYYDITTSGE